MCCVHLQGGWQCTRRLPQKRRWNLYQSTRRHAAQDNNLQLWNRSLPYQVAGDTLVPCPVLPYTTQTPNKTVQKKRITNRRQSSKASHRDTKMLQSTNYNFRGEIQNSAMLQAEGDELVVRCAATQLWTSVEAAHREVLNSVDAQVKTQLRGNSASRHWTATHTSRMIQPLNYVYARPPTTTLLYWFLSCRWTTLFLGVMLVQLAKKSL